MLSVSIFLALAATASPPRPSLPSASLKTEISEHLDTVLADDQPTRYFWPRVKSQKVYCGLVITQNRSGGYSGHRVYYVITDGRPAEAVFDSEALDIATIVCKHEGYPTAPPIMIRSGS